MILFERLSCRSRKFHIISFCGTQIVVQQMFQPFSFSETWLLFQSNPNRIYLVRLGFFNIFYIVWLSCRSKNFNWLYLICVIQETFSFTHSQISIQTTSFLKIIVEFLWNSAVFQESFLFFCQTWLSFKKVAHFILQDTSAFMKYFTTYLLSLARFGCHSRKLLSHFILWVKAVF